MGRSSATLTLLAFALAALLPQRASALEILQPANVSGTYASTEAMFGTPRYGSSLVAQLVYFPSDANGCVPYNRKDLDHLAPGSQPVIVLVERGGGCTFVQKVRDVEYMGRAQAVVVFDNRQEHAFAMADDGTGSDIKIPSVMVKYSVGLKLRDACNSTHPGYAGPVMASITWDIPSPDDHVEWQLWSSSNDLSDAEAFKLQFGPVAQQLELSGRASFSPRYFFFNGSVFGCLDRRATVPSTGFACGRQCTNDGRYCTEDPDGRLLKGLSGGDVIMENLRQICIRDQLAPLNQTHRWWTYVRLFHEQCMGTPSTNATQRALDRRACSTLAQQGAGIDDGQIAACVAASGGSPYNGGANTLLDKEIHDRYDAHVYNFPDVRINTKDYAGTWTCPAPISLASCPVLAAICDGLPDGEKNRPPQCLADYCWGGADACGVCEGDNSTCADCAGVPNGGGAYDCLGACNGPHSFDACNTCLPRNSSERCELCRADAGKGAVLVAANAAECAAQGGTWTKQGGAPGTNPGGGPGDTGGGKDHTGAIVGVALASCAGLIFVLVTARRHARAREDKMRRDFAEILSNYVPLDDANAAQAAGRGSGVSAPTSKAGAARRAVGKGLSRLAGKRTQRNPIVQHAEDDEDGERGQWTGGGDATFDGEDDDVEMQQVTTQPIAHDTV